MNIREALADLVSAIEGKTEHDILQRQAATVVARQALADGPVLIKLRQETTSTQIRPHWVADVRCLGLYTECFVAIELDDLREHLEHFGVNVDNFAELAAKVWE